jgi:hypothetical protein
MVGLVKVLSMRFFRMAFSLFAAPAAKAMSDAAFCDG